MKRLIEKAGLLIALGLVQQGVSADGYLREVRVDQITVERQSDNKARITLDVERIKFKAYNGSAIGFPSGSVSPHSLKGSIEVKLTGFAFNGNLAFNSWEPSTSQSNPTNNLYYTRSMLRTLTPNATIPIDLGRAAVLCLEGWKATHSFQSQSHSDTSPSEDVEVNTTLNLVGDITASYNGGYCWNINPL